jgi:predicted acyltransferase
MKFSIPVQPSRKSQPFLGRHSLRLAALGVVLLLIALYRWSNSFFGNAIADWTGVFVTIGMTKFL